MIPTQFQLASTQLAENETSSATIPDRLVIAQTQEYEEENNELARTELKEMCQARGGICRI